MEQELSALITTLQNNLDNPDSLSRIIVQLSLVNFKVNKLMAEAELEEEKAKQSFLDSPYQDEKGSLKRMSSAEAETRAVVQTHNDYGKAKNISNSIPEIMNAIKKRIETLSFEYSKS